MIKKDQIGLWLQLIFVFFLPLWQQVSVVSLIALIVFAIFSGSWKGSLKLFRDDKVLWLFVAFYLIHVLGIFYSQNMDYGFFDLQVKLSYLFIPLFLAAILIQTVNLKKIKWSFIMGNTLAGIICLAIAIFRYTNDGQASHFFYIDFSHFLHTTYFSMYLNLSVIFLIDEWLKKTDPSSGKRIFVPVLALFLLIIIILLFARTALAVCFFTIFLFLVLNRKRWLRDRQKIVFLLLAGLLIVSFQFTVLHFNNRFVQVENVMQHSGETLNENSLSADSLKSEEENSTSTRLRLWKNALLLIEQHPIFGVGTGDIKDELNAEYTSTGYDYGAKGDFNPHNQYLHTTVMLGLFGLIVLLAFILIPLRISSYSRNWVYFSFLLIVLLNSFTESILEVQKGVLWAAYFQVLFYMNCKFRQNDLCMKIDKTSE